jgi:hypothetical protein
MKLKALLLALFTAGFAVSIAVAATPAAADKDKRKPIVATATGTTTGSTTGATTTGATTTSESKKGKDDAKKAETCKHGKKIVVTGDYVAAGTGGFALKVTGGNKAGKAWKDKQATVLVDNETKFNGKKRKLADLVAGDRVNVQGYACKADVAAGSLLARKVTSKGPKGAKDDDHDEDDDEKTTSTTTTVATTTAP